MRRCASLASLSIVPVNTATNSAIPIANPTWRDMFTIPEPSPTSWPRIDPIEPIVTAGNAAPTPTPSSASRHTALHRDGSAGRSRARTGPPPSRAAPGRRTPAAGPGSDSRPTSGDTIIAMIATGVIASAASISE